MAAPRVLILRAPGTNCDEETAYAFELAGAEAERVHVNRLIENPALAARYQIVCVPGGFSYGDDIAAGRILAGRMQRHLSTMLQDFCGENDQRLMLGICNGMQVLMRLGVLASQSGEDESEASASLAWNHHGRFEDRWVHLRVDADTPCVFLRGIEKMYLPMAHAEGRFITASQDVYDRLQQQGRLALRYSNDAGEVAEETLPFPVNPNGSQGNVAGVCDSTGRVFGLMPHPERFVDPTQHPCWTRQDPLPEEGQGLAMFRNAVQYFA